MSENSNGVNNKVSEECMCVRCNKEIAYFKEWKCATCDNLFDENCYIYDCILYGCADAGKRQCKNCIFLKKETKYCIDEDCPCENRGIKTKREYRLDELKRAYENAFGI